MMIIKDLETTNALDSTAMASLSGGRNRTGAYNLYSSLTDRPQTADAKKVEWSLKFEIKGTF